MRFFVVFSWAGTLLAVFSNPLPSDMFSDDFYGSDSDVQGGSLFGDIASIDSSMENLHLEPSPQASVDSENIWTSGNENYDMLAPDGSPDPMISEGSDLLASSCGGPEVKRRDQMRARDGGVCQSTDEALKFKIPTLTPLSLPKKPSQTEVIPTLGRLRLGPPFGKEDPVCNVEPYDHHLCCDGPLGDEMMDFGDLQVYTPVKNCSPGKIELPVDVLMMFALLSLTDG